MTTQKNLKKIIRERMTKTGQRYASARRDILKKSTLKNPSNPLDYHLPGNIPSSTALRILLAAAGFNNPANNKPPSEALTFGLAGGIGVCLFAMRYEKQDFSSFFVHGRHSWQDDLAYYKNACKHLKLDTTFSETSSTKTAEENLRSALESNAPVLAWVDAALLPHHNIPESFAGGGYHVITIYNINDDDQTATIGDLTPSPITIPLTDLAASRARIKKQKNRLLSIKPVNQKPDLPNLINTAIQTCHTSLVKQRMKNFTIEAFKTWADRIHGSKHKEAWQTMFKPGPNLWRALTLGHFFIEHFATGGGLSRPMYADFLTEAATITNNPKLKTPAKSYKQLGDLWSNLAHDLLPDDVPQTHQAHQLMEQIAEINTTNPPDAPDQLHQIWSQLDNLADLAEKKFPMTDTQVDQHLASLKPKILHIYNLESEAHTQLGQALNL